MINENIKRAREKFSYKIGERITQKKLADKIGVSQSYIGDIESGRTKPNPEILKKIADLLETSIEELIQDPRGDKSLTYDIGSKKVDSKYVSESESKWNPSLSQKDKIDIAKEVDEILEGLDSETSLAFDGYEIELDEETKKLLKQSLKQTKELARLIAKKKFTPKKYRN